MSPGPRRAVGRRGTDTGTLTVADRRDALQRVLTAGEGRIAEELLERARTVVESARRRDALSAEHTVVALAGSTGSGKSSLLNALVGRTVAVSGVERPTTSAPTAAVWGPGADPLLDWLEVTERHRVDEQHGPGERQANEDLSRSDGLGPAGPARSVGPDGAIDGPLAAADAGLVVLDLPDHDSVRSEHRVIAERMVDRVDLLVWVTDPQKYADQILHDGFLRPLANHSDVMVLVLNQIDRLSPDEAQQCIADLRRLATLDGLANATVLGASARTGKGIAELRERLTDAAERREAATKRLVTNLRDSASPIVEACGAPPSAHPRADEDLTFALSGAAGVDTVVTAVEGRTRQRAKAATGWPVTRWLGRFRADPLRRLNLHRGPQDADLARTSLPEAGATQAAQVHIAVRNYVAARTDGIPAEWAFAARDCVSDAADALPEELDLAVAGTELEATGEPAWWRVLNVWQWTLFTVLVGGLAWLTVLAGFSYFQLPPPPTPKWRDFPWPTLLVAAGAGLGIVTSLVAAVVNRFSAQRRAARARRRLLQTVDEVGQRLVANPLAQELAGLDECRANAVIAARGS